MAPAYDDRYLRQIPVVGREGQDRLSESTVVIAGIGGLGSPVALYLAAAGVGTMRIIDRDAVDATNLNRQVLHWERDVGREKVVSAGEKLRSVNSSIGIEALACAITADNACELIAGADIVVDATDNFPVRYALNRAVCRHGIPLVHGAIRGFDGQVTTVVPGETACLRCIFPEPPPAEATPVLGTTAGIIGLMQANEVIKYLTGAGPLLANRLVLWNGCRAALHELPVTRDGACPDCAGLPGDYLRETDSE
ncbi:MAG: HesA/MoeB/ThiF family protein [Methanomicrobiales archaeon]|nr:HesA/MoeB/ThiF family protein [Methanomicrobiales archaeon]